MKKVLANFLLWLKAFKFSLFGMIVCTFFEVIAFVVLINFVLPVYILTGLLSVMPLMPILINIGMQVDFTTKDWEIWFKSKDRW